MRPSYYNKQNCFRPGDHVQQEKRYDGHRKFHCFAVLVWVDVLGTICRVDTALDGSMHDRTIFNLTASVQNSGFCSIDDEKFVCDTGFVGYGLVIAPFKKNQAANFLLRTMYNKDIRKHRICNE